MQIRLIDAFASKAFTGNPAAVCILESPADPGWMQSVAMEMNQAETAFAYPIADGYHLRWFTPTQEVELCGHATLATAHALFELGVVGPYRFDTLSEELVVTGSDGSYTMDFPAEPVSAAELPNRVDGLEQAIYTGKNRMDWLVELPSADDVRGFEPNLVQIAALGERALIITAKSDGADCDFVSRLFAPCVGIPEDPVTGSAHCALAPYWAQKLDRGDVTGYQASKRGGYVSCQWSGNDRVLLSGRAITVLTGTLSESAQRPN